MASGRLLAKSVASGEPAQKAHTLVGHTAMVVAAAKAILDVAGEDALSASGMPSTDLPELRRIVLVGALVHDWGKCSDHFQAMVRRERAVPQLVRHEAATLWLTWPGQLLSEFLLPAVGSRDNLMLALVAAAGHHRKFLSGAVADSGTGAGTRMILQVSNPDFRTILEKAAKWTQLEFGQIPRLEDVVIESTRRSNPVVTLEDWQDECEAVTSAHTNLLALAKALLLAADVAGSALPRAGDGIQWISRVLSHRPGRETLQSVVQVRLGGQPLRPFQEAVSGSRAPVTLVRAGCGTGKTAAAYQWAAQQAAGRQLWITYPTTGTATEGYRDYVHDDRLELGARLEHSRAEVDLDILGLSDADDGHRDIDRLDALRAWEQDVVVCTVDTVLGLVQNQRKGLYAFPTIARSALVFDEVHAYDDGLFGALIRFLRALPGIPCLLMTASLPEPRLRELEHVVSEVHGRALAVVEGPADLEQLPRYYKTDAEPWPLIEQHYHAGQKVLWICNTVDRSIRAADQAEQAGIRSSIYHSRFAYRDRVHRHGELVAAFKTRGAAFACTTQVAEMSLDISADLLITELAPIPAMIQRLGRLNRRSTPKTPFPPAPFVAIEVDKPLPYTAEQLQEAREWLLELGTSPISQQDLVASWRAVAERAEPSPPTISRWLDGGFLTEVGPLRDIEAAVTVLLPQHARAVSSGKARALEYALPMTAPYGFDWLRWPRVHGLPVPPEGAIVYDERRGAQWQRNA